MRIPNPGAENGLLLEDSQVKNGLIYCLFLLFTTPCLIFGSGAPFQEKPVLEDFSRAVVVAPADLNPVEEKALQVLIEEVEERTTIRLPRSQEWPDGSIPVLAVGPVSRLRDVAGSTGIRERGLAEIGAEGFHLRTGSFGREAPAALVLGQDSRGVLFGVGRLLREMRLKPHQILIPSGLEVDESPAYPVRGHELGYRPKTNSYDGFTAEMWEQYIRDLAVFGANSVELIPPRSDDAPDSPHFPIPQMEMMEKMSQILKDYDMDVWIWYPALDEDYSNPATVEFALNEWAEVFRRLPRIDAVYIPGGDPGHTPPRVLAKLMEKQAENLKKFHPEAEIWTAPEGFTKEWMDDFYEIIREEPEWLSGLVYGPWVPMAIEDFRKTVPAVYPIRRYPDITHTRSSQYPVPEWDMAHALTSGREPINPRPKDQEKIFHWGATYANGFISYSEGVNDDVNKAIWSGLGWNPKVKVEDILREFSRYFIGPDYEDSFSQGLLALEENWRGPLLTNERVYTTLKQFQEMERNASPATLRNWRFQQALYRAYYDAYTRARLIYETSQEEEAWGYLRLASKIGTELAIEKATAILKKADLEKTALDWRLRVFQLAEALFQSIRAQLSVPLYQAISVGRGANLDSVDYPLNSRVWMLAQFETILQIPGETDRRRKIDELLNWTNPGPGGFYDDLGNLSNQAHLVTPVPYAEDPMFFENPLINFVCQPGWRRSWCDHADNLFKPPVTLSYQNLDPTGAYAVRILYAGSPERDGVSLDVRLVADGEHEIHPYIAKPRPVKPLEFEIPQAATKDGNLTLSCWGVPGRGGPGRACQIGEVWLIRR